MDWKPGPDLYIGLGLGFGLVLIAAWIIGLPLRDLALFALVFLAAGAAFVAFLRWRANRR